MTDLVSVPDDVRTDPARARCWWVSSGGSFTVVVATCPEEARILGLAWIAQHRGRTKVTLTDRARVREAGPEDVARWRALRAQQAAGVAGLRQEMPT